MFRIVFAFALVLLLAIAGTEVQAKRLGGGTKIGRQNSALVQRTPAASPLKQSAPPGVSPTGVRSRPWGGILGGLAAGLGLAAVFHAMGLGEGLSSFLGSALMIALLVGIVAMIINLARRRAPSGQAEQLRYAGNITRGYDQNTLGIETMLGRNMGSDTGAAQATSIGSPSVPAGFDANAFLRNARQHYTALQQAWDAADLDRMRALTTPDMFDALLAELQSRGMAPNRTEVVTLDATLLAVEDAGADDVASVEYTGLIREDTWGGASPVREIWNFARPKNSQSGWLLAGIQQLG